MCYGGRTKLNWSDLQQVDPVIRRLIGHAKLIGCSSRTTTCRLWILIQFSSSVISCSLTCQFDRKYFIILENTILLNDCDDDGDTVCILYSLQSKATRLGCVLETTTFSSQSATILVASLLLYLVLFDLNRFLVVCSSSSSSSMFSRLPVLKIFYACSSVYFTFSTITVPLLLTHDLHVRMLRVVQ